MIRFESPAFRLSREGLPAAAVRGLLGAAALAFTGALWLAVGAQAGHFGEPDTAVQVVLEPVVISGRRLPPEGMTAALGAGPAAVDCPKDAVPPQVGSRNGVTLNQ